MSYWISFFFVVASVAAACGFGGFAVSAAGCAKAVFFVFLFLGVASLVSEHRRPFAHRTPASRSAPIERTTNVLHAPLV